MLPAFLLTPDAQANTTLFNDSGSCTVNTPCWAAQDFGILVGVGQTLNANNDYVTGSPSTVIINGAIGVGASGTTTGTITESGGHAEVWTGPIDFADGTAATAANDPKCPTGDTCSVATGTNIRNVTLSGGVTALSVTTGIYDTQPGVTTALTEVEGISSYWKGYASTSGSISLQATSGQITVGSGTTGVFVYDVSSINLSNAGLLIDAGTGSVVIINDSGSASFTATGSGKFYVSLEGGITADDVLFNIDSLSSTLTISGATTNGSYLDADFIVAGGYNVAHATLDGRLLGWGTNTGTFGTAFEVDAPPSYTPEPEDWLLVVTGLGAFGYVYRKQLRLNRNFALGTRFRERIEADAGESGRCVPAAAGGTAGAGGGDGAPPQENGIPPPRGGGGGGSGGVDLAREP